MILAFHLLFIDLVIPFHLSTCFRRFHEASTHSWLPKCSPIYSIQRTEGEYMWTSALFTLFPFERKSTKIKKKNSCAAFKLPCIRQSISCLQEQPLYRHRQIHHKKHTHTPTEASCRWWCCQFTFHMEIKGINRFPAGTGCVAAGSCRFLPRIGSRREDFANQKRSF